MSIESRYKIINVGTQQGVKIENKRIKKVSNTKTLGVQIDENLNWGKHINCIGRKITCGIGAI